MVIEGLHVRKGVPVGYGDGVQATVVATGAPRPILLGNQVQRGCSRGVGAANNTFLHGEEFLLGDAVFFRVQTPGAGKHGGGATCVHVMHNAVERFGGGRHLGAAAAGIPRAAVVPVAGARRRQRQSWESRG